MAFGA